MGGDAFMEICRLQIWEREWRWSSGEDGVVGVMSERVTERVKSNGPPWQATLDCHISGPAWHATEDH